MPADLPTQIRGLTRARGVLLALAVAAPMLLGALFDRQIRRLEALADHGREATGIVARAQGGGSGGITFYEYTVGGASYSWNVKRADAPFAPGVTFPVTYLPEDPSFSRPGPPPSGARAEAEGNARSNWKGLLGVSGFFLLNAAVVHAKLRKVRRDGGEGATGALVSPVVLGRILAVVFLIITLGVNLDDQVRIVQEKAFGVAPFGLPVTYVVMLAQAVLFAPFFSVTEHLVRIVQRALADGASISRVGLLVYLAEVRKQRPELVRSRNIVLAGLVYFVALMGGWIAYASAKGI